MTIIFVLKVFIGSYTLPILTIKTLFMLMFLLISEINLKSLFYN